MMKLLLYFHIFIVVFGRLVYSQGKSGEQSVDTPCVARSVGGESVLCVCNATYCDTLTRQPPGKDTFVAYTTSLNGLRYNKTTGPLLTCNDLECGKVTLELDPAIRHQTVEGFGGAVTDAAGINWKNLTQPLSQYLVNSYFSDEGLQYNMIRVPIGGCDFSTRPYAYNELPVNDTKLTNYTLSYEDYHYKIPFITAAMKVSSTPIHVIASTWSPPAWMKTNDALVGRSQLRPEYYDTYADYHYKFIEKYAAQGVPVWGITTTNEPTDGVIPIWFFNSLGWTANTLGSWIANNLGPKIRNSTYKDVKIIAGDDQRLALPYWINRMLELQPKALDYIDGVGVHFYMDFITPASVLSEVMKPYPQKFLLATEACEGSNPWQRKKVDLGSWQRAYNYISDIITDLNHNAIGWIDWNLCLNAQGGPNWVRNFVDSPIIVFPERNEFVKQPLFYAMGHFSKFIPRGSQRVEVVEKKSLFASSLEHVAFLTTRKTVVVVFYNKSPERTVYLKLGDQIAAVKSEAKSVSTVELPYDPNEKQTQK